MYKAKQAIILAAGKGTRLRPVTLEIPKPLIRVNGVQIIDTIIRALHANGITNIHIIVGYLKEQFQFLIKKYPGIDLIENPYYDTYNNISSMYVAREYIEDTIIVDGDQIIYNKQILSPEFKYSGYNAVWVDTPTKEWLMTVKDDIVIQCSRNGGKNGWQLFGISRWNSEDGKKLRRHLEIEFEEKKNYQIYWDDIAMFCYPAEYRLGIHKMNAEDILEIDDLYELVKLDKSYAHLLTGDNVK